MQTLLLLPDWADDTTSIVRVNCDIPGDTGAGVRKESTNRLYHNARGKLALKKGGSLRVLVDEGGP